MYKSIFLLSLLFFSISVKAHQPDISTTMLVERENNTWVIQIIASLTAFQQEVRSSFSGNPYKTPEEFKEQVLSHIKNNLKIIFNENNAIQIKKSYVKLGHETKVVFEITGVPLDINTLSVRNSAFKNIHRNQSALVILKKGISKEHFILNDANEHTLKLAIEGDRFIVLGQENKITFRYYLYILIIAVLGYILMLYYKKIKNNNAVQGTY